MGKRRGVHVILGAITPDYDKVDADQLSYPNLRSTLQNNDFMSFLKRRTGELLSRRPSFKPAVAREDLQVAYLLTAAYRLQKASSPPERLFWSTQFTMTSVQLFGKPLSREVARLAADELKYFETAASEFDTKKDFFEPVLSAYRSLLSGRVKPGKSIEARYSKLLTEVRDYFLNTYASAFACFDDYTPHTLLTSADIAKVFRTALRTMQKSDEAWSDWRVIQDRSAKLSVNVEAHKILVGKNRAAITAHEARGLFAHEVLIHAQRSVQGAKISTDLAIGLPDYLDAEEGLGVLVESAVNGGIPAKIKDRYVDIALALGSLRHLALSRHEMYTFCYSRAVIRCLAKGEKTNLDEIEKTTWEHVNRIFRGSLGNRYVGVFTKDVTYYQGFVNMAQYLEKARKRNALPQAIQYLLRGKFDPTIRAHQKVLKASSN